MQLRSIDESKLAIGLPIPHLDNLRATVHKYGAKFEFRGKARKISFIFGSNVANT